jgi:oxalate decarboxylase
MRSNRKSKLTRRELLGVASAATFGAAFLPASARASGRTSQQEQNYQVGKEPGKHEPLANFKFDIESSKGWFGEAGSAKEANVEEFPISQSIAGVSMRLKPGGVRELHWHAIAAEWALVLEGTIRATVIAPNGQSATDVFELGDIWYFPKGHGHSLQTISNRDSHFVPGF